MAKRKTKKKLLSSRIEPEAPEPLYEWLYSVDGGDRWTLDPCWMTKLWAPVHYGRQSEFVGKRICFRMKP